MTESRAAAASAVLAPPHTATEPPGSLVGLSPSLERLRRDILRAAGRNLPALIVGEPGSGKSLVARALQEQGARSGNCCVVVACEAFPESLLEMELFGCDGNGPGGMRHHPGLIERSAGGTVILENIDAASARTQARLARFLTTGVPQPPGQRPDARIVVTSTIAGGANPRVHRDIGASFGAGLIHVPSLRERRADIPSLARFFAAASKSDRPPPVFSAAALAALIAYSWPGNVRQLRTVVERVTDTAGAGEVQPHELPVGIRPRPGRGVARRLRAPSVGEELLARVQISGESFWSAVYPLFMKREITRADLRELVRLALEAARGNADELLRILNLPHSDARRFLRFLHRYDCGL